LDIDKEILKGYIDIIILSLINKKPLYGFEMAKTVREKCNQEFELKEGTMYLALKRLEKNSFIEAFWGEEASEGGRRKYYRILPSGQERLKQKREEWRFVQRILGVFMEDE
jgi:DNA-binding PadR family transcriptional regulator